MPLSALSSFLIGFGLTFAAAAAPVLVTEIAYPTHRAPATSLYNTLWCVDHFTRRRFRLFTENFGMDP